MNYFDMPPKIPILSRGHMMLPNPPMLMKL